MKYRTVETQLHTISIPALDRGEGQFKAPEEICGGGDFFSSSFHQSTTATILLLLTL
jgi:hypothetical protein